MKTEYQVVWGRSATSLEVIVNSNIEMGWRPIGGVAVRSYGQCYQAMIRTTTPVDKQSSGGMGAWLEGR